MLSAAQELLDQLLAFLAVDPGFGLGLRIELHRHAMRPRAVGRWHLPGTMDGDDAPPPARLPAPLDAGFRAHNTNVYPERPDRCYLCYIDGGVMVLDIADRSRPKIISHWTKSPP